MDDQYNRVTGNGYVGNDTSSDTNYNDGDKDLNRTIPVIEEDIEVGKRKVATGGVRLRSRIIEKPIEENLRLREEHINVERNKVDRPATDAELENFKTGTVEVIEHKEIPEVQKTSTVVEEVSLAKKVDHRNETVRDSVKKTEVDVEDIQPGKTEDDNQRYSDEEENRRYSDEGTNRRFSDEQSNR